jgi:RAB protein geranylgeranyltransferase component A
MEWYAKHAAAEEERCNLHQGADAQPPSQDPSAPSQLLKADRPPLDPSESISSSETAAGATAEQNPHRVASPEGKSSFETTEQVLPLHRDASEICGIRARVEPKCIPGGSRDYSIDIAHQALECTGPCVEAIRKAGLHLYIDFVPVSDAYVYSAADRALHPVPSGVAGVHAMSGLTAAEKRTMWLFMRQVERAATGAPVPLFQGRHFAADLQACKLPQSMHDAVLYGVLQCESAVDNDSELPGAAALAAILRYMSQAGAYVTGQAPFIEPCYGSGEVAQAAIRACCVHGGVAALGTSADALLSVVGEVTGVQLACGHVVRCKAVAVSAAVLPREDVGVRSSAGVDAQGMHRAGVHESSAAECSSGSGRRQRVTAWCASSQNVREESGAHGQRGTAAAGPHAPVDNAGDAPLDCGGCREWPDDVSGMSTRVDCGVAEGSKQSLMQTHNTALEHRKVARGIVLLDGPLLAMTTNCLVTIPPGACRNTHPVAVWQCHSSLHACPPGHVLLYLSTRCTGTPAADILQPCLSALLAASDTVHTDTGGAVDAAEAGAVREAVDAGGVGTVRAAVDAAEASAVGTAVAGTMQQAVDVAEAGAAPEAVGAAEVGDAHLGGAVGAAAAGTGGAVDTAEASTARGAGDNPAEGASGPCRGEVLCGGGTLLV